MKNIFIKPIFLSILCLGLFTSCVNDDEFAIPEIKIPFYSEDFQNLDERQNSDAPHGDHSSRHGGGVNFPPPF